MKILITGGAGFIGGHLYKSLLKNGASDIVIIDNLSPQIHGEEASFNDSRVEFIKMDIRNISNLDRSFDFDIVFHLVSETGTGQSMYEISKYVDVNENGTAALLEYLLKFNKKNFRIVLTSSRSIYGEGAYINNKNDLIHPESRSLKQLEENKWDMFIGQEKLKPIPTPETLPPKPGSIYAATKYSQEMLIKVFCSSNNIPYSICRLQNVYGEGQSLRNPYTGIISIFYNRMRQKLPINIFEDGYESRDFIHVEDVVTALIKSSISKSNALIVNVGSGKQTSVIELAKTLKKISASNVELNITGAFRLGDIRHCYADLSFAHKNLEFFPQVTLESGITRFVNWASMEPEYKDKSEIAQKELSEKGLA